MNPLHTEILRSLAYYDIWEYPLTTKELYMFLPGSSFTYAEFLNNLENHGAGANVMVESGYYFLRGRTKAIVERRKEKELHARRLWNWARISTQIIKRFPFVRAIMISGDLSKNATDKNSDIDFFVVTEPNRLWIARTLLILFKKTFLLNRKKFFCLNYFATSDCLRLDEENIYVATEIAHLKPLYNADLFFNYLAANNWIWRYFPNFDLQEFDLPKTNTRTSYLQKLLEVPFSFIPADKLDTYLLKKMRAVWMKRYPEYDDLTRDKIFRCTKHESRAYIGNFEERVLALYDQKLREFGVAD